MAKLSDETRNALSDIDWRSLKGMRNILTHNYGSMDTDIAWNAMTIHLPEICEKCSKAITDGYCYLKVDSEELAAIKQSGIEVTEKTVNGITAIRFYDDDSDLIKKIIQNVKETKAKEDRGKNHINKN